MSPTGTPSSRISLAALLLRVVFGGAMLTVYGLPKLADFAHWVEAFPTPFGWNPTVAMGLIVLAEVGCAALVLAGWKTRWAALPLVLAMAVALLVVHGGAGWNAVDAVTGLPRQGGGEQERSALYLTGFAAIALLGGGRWSVDGWLQRRVRR